MKSMTSPQFLEWPKIQWKESGWWLTIAGTVMTLFTFIVPQFNAYSLALRVAIAIAALFFTPIIIVIGKFLLILGKTAYKRSVEYQNIYDILNFTKDELTATKQMIVYFQNSLRQDLFYEVSQVQLYQNQLFIHINKKPRSKLEMNSEIILLDTLEGITMGQFKVVKIKERSYLAKQDGYIHPLWLGDIISKGLSETLPPPHTYGVLKVQQESIQ